MSITFVSQSFLDGDIPSYAFTVISVDEHGQQHETAVSGYDAHEAQNNFRLSGNTERIYDIVEAE